MEGIFLRVDALEMRRLQWSKIDVCLCVWDEQRNKQACTVFALCGIILIRIDAGEYFNRFLETILTKFFFVAKKSLGLIHVLTEFPRIPQPPPSS